MTPSEARATVKAINRHIRKDRPFQGGMQYGVDWPTWATCYPQTATLFNRAAQVLMGRDGRFMPIFNYT